MEEGKEDMLEQIGSSTEANIHREVSIQLKLINFYPLSSSSTVPPQKSVYVYNISFQSFLSLEVWVLAAPKGLDESVQPKPLRLITWSPFDWVKYAVDQGVNFKHL